MSKQKTIILLTVLIDIIGLGVVIPVLPFYVSTFNSNPIIITLLFAAFSLFSFVSAPFLGSLSDKVGRRPILLISILSTAIGWLVFAAANSLFLLFLGRIIDGLAAGNIPIAQSYLVDIARDQKERTTNLGLIGAAFGVGFIIGPALGGLLGSISHSLPFWFVGGLALVNFILGYFMLPETNKNLKPNEALSFNPFTPLIKVFKNKILLPSYVTWFLFNTSAIVMNTIFALYLWKTFGFGEFAAGLFMTGVGVIISINQGVAIKHFWLKYFKEPDLEFSLLFIFAIGYLLMSIGTLWLFILGLLMNTFGQSILRVVITSQATAQAPIDGKGETLGILASVASLAMIIGPLISGPTFNLNYKLPLYLAAGLSLLAFVIIWHNKKNLPNNNLPEDINIEPVM